MSTQVTIIYNGPLTDVNRIGESIYRLFLPDNSFVDTKIYTDGYENAGSTGDGKSYGRSIYATNADGWGKLKGLMPMSSTPVRFAQFERAAKIACEAKKSDSANAGITFSIEGYAEDIYWNQIAPHMAMIGYYIKIGDKEYGNPPAEKDPVIIPPNSEPDTIRNVVADIASGKITSGAVQLVADTTTYGVGVPEGTDLTFELQSHELDPIPDENGEYAGSTGTKTQAMQLLKDSNITIKNGTITGNNGNPMTKMVIQNYSNLTLDNVVVQDAGTDTYALSNNFGEIHLKNGTQINATGNHIAFDLWYGMAADYDDGVTVYIDTPDVVINGPIEYGHASRIKDEEQFLQRTHLYVCKDYNVDSLTIIPTSSAPGGYKFEMNEEIGYWELVPGEEPVVAK